MHPDRGRPASGLALVLLLGLACRTAPPAEAPAPAHAPIAAPRAADAAAGPISDAEVRRMLSALAHDSMGGRRTATRGELRAVRLIASEMARIGLEPAGDSGFIQRVELAALTGANGAVRLRLRLPDSTGTMPSGEPRAAFNVLGVIRGTDPAVRDEVVIVGAHLDHVGIGRPVDGDSIYNGADDDASGVVATLGIAAALAAAPAPRRTVLFAAFTGEEMGLLGTRWYIARPAFPIAATVANLQIEMIGRPDSLAGGPGKGWLTGYERSTMGDILKASGSPIVPDPRPSQNFFMRSDNIAFARLGIPAHTLSSFNLHGDYHRPSDEIGAVDIPHMTAVIRAAADMVRQLADGPRPEWHPGGRP